MWRTKLHPCGGGDPQSGLVLQQITANKQFIIFLFLLWISKARGTGTNRKHKGNSVRGTISIISTVGQMGASLSHYGMWQGLQSSKKKKVLVYSEYNKCTRRVLNWCKKLKNSYPLTPAQVSKHVPRIGHGILVLGVTSHCPASSTTHNSQPLHTLLSFKGRTSVPRVIY